MLTPKEIMELVARTLDNKKAWDLQVLKTEAVTVLADYFVICTGNSTTHVKTLAEEVDKVLSDNGEPPRRTEGYRGGGWTLIDFGCVIVHVFTDESRKFYNLERLWQDAEKVDITHLLTPTE